MFTQCAGRATIGAAGFQLLDLATNDAIRTRPRILNTHRHPVINPRTSIGPWVMRHQPLEIRNRLIAPLWAVQLGNAVVWQCLLGLFVL
ncbi:hypothetical protein D9M72_554920 [compost metagenome]